MKTRWPHTRRFLYLQGLITFDPNDGRWRTQRGKLKKDARYLERKYARKVKP